MNIKQPYGLRNGEIVSIDDVESGLACNCICPACKGTLIAKKGDDRQDHFAHYNSEDCGKGVETIVHKLAKDIIAEAETFTTPELKFRGSDIILFEPKEIFIDEVKLEHRLDDIIPDIIITSRGKELLVEIAVTHEIDFYKKRKINDMRIATIEIYAKHLLTYLYNNGDLFFKDQAFRNELITGTLYKTWIYNKKTESIKQHLKENYADRLERKRIKFDEYEALNYIDNCPAWKRTWKSGYKKGKPYANIDTDCSCCQYCVGMDYNEWTNPRNRHYQITYPVTAYCCGNFGDEFQELVTSVCSSI